MNFVCVVRLHITVNNTKTLSVANQCLYGKFMSPATIKSTCVLIKNVWCCIKTI